MRRIGVLLRIILGFVVFGLFSEEAVSKTASLSQQHVVHIKTFAFSPEQLTVSPGDTILWVNQDIVPHLLNIANNQWQSPVIEEGQSWEMVVNEQGSYAYLCVFHPQMTGAFATNQ